jgi:hypothetical protein
MFFLSRAILRSAGLISMRLSISSALNGAALASLNRVQINLWPQLVDGPLDLKCEIVKFLRGPETRIPGDCHITGLRMAALRKS